MSAPSQARRVRPHMPHYGVSPRATAGMLDWAWVADKMSEARNYWVCTTRADGRPHAAPVWGVWIGEAFLFGTDRKSVKAANIRRDNRAAVHLESGDDVVIFEGRLFEPELSPAERAEINQAFQQKYAFDLDGGESDALLLRLAPGKVMAWLESDFPATATAWLFDV